MMPHCDIATGKIYGCKKGSYSWWHEKGHLEFNTREDTSRLTLVQENIFGWWVVIVSLGFLWWPFGAIGIIIALFYKGIGWYEEWWCNRYADKHFLESLTRVKSRKVVSRIKN